MTTATVETNSVESTMRLKIPVDKIVIPKSRQRAVSPTDEKNKAFVDSIARVGMLQPIDVRLLSDGRYEIVFGVRRVMAAKKLGMTEVPALVSNWTDDQVAFVGLAENAHRQHLNAAEYGLYVKKLLAELERCFGKDPGNAAGGLARAAKAKKASGSGRFETGTAESAKTDDLAGEEDESPALSAALNAGAPTPIPIPQSHTKLLAESTGKHLTNARNDALIAKTLSEDELRCLQHDDVTKEHLLRLCKEFKNAEERDLAIRRIILGINADTAIDEAKREIKAPNEDEIEKNRVHAEERSSDKEWLLNYCNAVRNKLQDTTRFDLDALSYRATRSERAMVRECHKGLLVRSAAKAITPLVRLIANVCWVEHPALWHLCSACNGNNVDRKDCDRCVGAGYRPRFSVPTELRK